MHQIKLYRAPVTQLQIYNIVSPLGSHESRMFRLGDFAMRENKGGIFLSTQVERYIRVL